MAGRPSKVTTTITPKGWVREVFDEKGASIASVEWVRCVVGFKTTSEITLFEKKVGCVDLVESLDGDEVDVSQTLAYLANGEEVL